MPEPIIGKISQETFAGIAGTAPSRISQFMNKFRKLGLIDYNGQIVVHNSLLNVVLNDNPHLRPGRSHPAAPRPNRQHSIGPQRSAAVFNIIQTPNCPPPDIIDLDQHAIARCCDA
jgi:hypothetical protein